MVSICLQSGHWNTNTGQTGAPREQERTIAIGKRLTDLLRANGYEVYHTDARADVNPAVTNRDWNLFLSLHCDANYPGNEGGGFADFPEPSTDFATKESQRIQKVFADNYFKDSGIRNVPSRSNANTRFYYMWSALSAKTPCVILEMGESIDPHDTVILDDTERQAKIILSVIKKALPTGTTPTPDPVPPTTDYKKKYEDEVNAHTATKEAFKKFKEDAAVSQEVAVKDALKKLNEKIDSAQKV